jgi:hypothetical protein
LILSARLHDWCWRVSRSARPLLQLEASRRHNISDFHIYIFFFLLFSSDLLFSRLYAPGLLITIALGFADLFSFCIFGTVKWHYTFSPFGSCLWDWHNDKGSIRIAGGTAATMHLTFYEPSWWYFHLVLIHFFVIPWQGLCSHDILGACPAVLFGCLFTWDGDRNPLYHDTEKQRKIHNMETGRFWSFLLLAATSILVCSLLMNRNRLGVWEFWLISVPGRETWTRRLWCWTNLAFTRIHCYIHCASIVLWLYSRPAQSFFWRSGKPHVRLRRKDCWMAKARPGAARDQGGDNGRVHGDEFLVVVRVVLAVLPRINWWLSMPPGPPVPSLASRVFWVDEISCFEPSDTYVQRIKWCWGYIHVPCR